MYFRALAALAVALLTQSPLANADETDADTAARRYFERACADKIERTGVYAPANHSFSDITTGATRDAVSWDGFRFELLCALPELDVYHCHTSDDVLTRFPSGSAGAGPGDFGAAAEMEFTCAKDAVLSGHPAPSLVHGLVTPRGEVIHYGFTAALIAALDERGRRFGRILKDDGSRAELEDAQADAQRMFNAINAGYFADFMAFAIKACPGGDIEHCKDFTVERFASALSPDDGRFIRVGAAPDTIVMAAQARGDITELTPETVGGFVADGKAVVSICARATEGLLPCAAATERIARLVGSCPRVKTGILDQDAHPQARDIYPLARDRSLLLFKTNPGSGLNEQFDLATMGEPTPQLIAMTLCGQPPLAIPSFAQ